MENWNADPKGLSKALMDREKVGRIFQIEYEIEI